MTKDLEVSVTSETRDYSYIREISATNGLKQTFIRLVTPASDLPLVRSHTVSAEVTFDIDPDGKLMGVTIEEWDHEQL